MDIFPKILYRSYWCALAIHLIFVTFVACLLLYSIICFIKGEFSWQCRKLISIKFCIVVGNVWGIGVTGGLAFASFYAVIVFINNNSEASEIYGQDIKIKRPPKIDPSFLMDSDSQKYAEIWFPIAYFAFNIISTLCLRFPLM